MSNTNHSEQQARAQLASIRDMVAALQCDYSRLQDLRDERDGFDVDEDTRKTWAEVNPEDAAELAELEEAAGDCEDEDEACQRIEEDALSVEVRSDWYTPGSEDDNKPSEFNILLCTGGPAVRIIGELDDHGTPDRARIEHQDWGTGWTHLYIEDDAAREDLLTYCRCFYFGE